MMVDFVGVMNKVTGVTSLGFGPGQVRSYAPVVIVHAVLIVIPY
jgi:hypothetical protein